MDIESKYVTTSKNAENKEDPYYSADAINILSECDRCILADQRIFYIHRPNRMTYWLPPRADWKGCKLGLDYGIERAVDEFGTHYFVNHLNQTTSYKLPNASILTDPDGMSVPPTRSCEILRDPRFNYGFIASSERPVVVIFVNPEGPSCGKLIEGDQLLSVNGIDVRNEDKLKVVEMIRKSDNVLKVEVSQSPRKLESSASNASSRRVRFTAEDTFISSSGAKEQHFVSSIPNVIRIYTEIGQVRSLKYDQERTTVEDILNTLAEKLKFKEVNHFALAMEQSFSLSSPRLNFLPLNKKLHVYMQSKQVRFRLRFAFPPRELLNYSKEDPNGFEYFYQQCVNDFVDGKYTEIRYEAILRLAALHIRQVCSETSIYKVFSNRINVYQVEEEYGLATFIPTFWLERTKSKELRRHLDFFLAKDGETFHDLRDYLIEQKSLIRIGCLSKNSIDVSADLARIIRIKYVTLISLLPDFGVVYCAVNYKPTEADMIFQIDSRQGLIIRYPGKGTSPPAITIDFKSISMIHVYEKNEITKCVCLNLSQRNLEFYVDKRDIDNLLTHIQGYARLAGNKELELREGKPLTEVSAPPYHGLHFVTPDGWNYASTVDSNIEKAINFSNGPPAFEQAIVSTNKYDQSLQIEEPSYYNDVQVLRRMSKHSVDDSPIVESNPISRGSLDRHKVFAPSQARRTSSQQRFTHMIIGTAQAILQRNRNTPKRFRDSLRIYRKRHSISNINPAISTSPKVERRWSSATRRDTIASTCSITDNPCVSRSALLLRPSLENILNGKLDSSNTRTPSLSQLQTGSLLKFQAFVNEISKASASTKIAKGSNKASKQKNRLAEKFRRSLSLDEKRVRFDFSSTSIILPPSPQPSINSPEDYDKEPANDEFLFKSYVTLCTKKFGKLSTSHTFPMTDEANDFGDDFCPRSYCAPEPSLPSRPPTVRRMSLKEFSGLENTSSTAFHNGLESPVLNRLQAQALNSPTQSRSSEFLDKIGSRRRSSSGMYGSNFGSREHVYEPFDKIIDEVNATVYDINLDTAKSSNENDDDSSDPLSRLDLARKRLSLTIEKMPTESPKKKVSIDVERNRIFIEIGRLSQVSKRLISVYTLNAEERQQNIQNASQLADSITSQCEKLLENRSSFYQAHLLKSELDQLLRSLSDCIKDLNLAVGKQRYGPEFKRLSKSSNTLAAAFTQLLKVIKSF